MELDEDDVGGGVDRLQRRVPAELTDLGGGLVRTVPAEKQQTNKQRGMWRARLTFDLFGKSFIFYFFQKLKADNNEKHIINIGAEQRYTQCVVHTVLFTVRKTTKFLKSNRYRVAVPTHFQVLE